MGRQKPFSPRLSRVIVHPVVRDISVTALTAVMMVVTNPLIIALLGRRLGPTALGEYLLLRRLVSGISSVALMGLGVGLPRYIARAQFQDDRASANYFVVALACPLLCLSALALITSVCPSLFSDWFFGDPRKTRLLFPLALLTIALTLEMIVYGYFRGSLAFRWANALQGIVIVIVPLIAVLGFGRLHSIALIVNTIGAMTLGCTVLFASRAFPYLMRLDLPRLVRHGTELLRFGLARMPGEIAYSGMIMIGPVVAAHYTPLAEVSYLLLGINALFAMQSAVSPLGIVLLAKVSQMLAAQQADRVRILLCSLFQAMLEISVVATIQIEIFLDVLLRTWLGSAFAPALTVVRIAFLAAPFVVIVRTMVSFIDAATVRALNGRNAVVASLVFGLVLAPTPWLHGRCPVINLVAIALLVAFILEAYLTLRTAKRVYSLTILWRQSVPYILLGLAFGLGSFAVRFARGDRAGILDFFALQSVWIVIYVLALYKMQPAWFTYFGRLLLGESIADEQ